MPVRVKKTRQNKKLERLEQFYRQSAIEAGHHVAKSRRHIYKIIIHCSNPRESLHEVD
jgi:ribosome-associated translation inhibitor RaiA